MKFIALLLGIWAVEIAVIWVFVRWAMNAWS